jgi:hypothetical protein
LAFVEYLTRNENSTPIHRLQQRWNYRTISALERFAVAEGVFVSLVHMAICSFVFDLHVFRGRRIIRRFGRSRPVRTVPSGHTWHDLFIGVFAATSREINLALRSYIHGARFRPTNILVHYREDLRSHRNLKTNRLEKASDPQRLNRQSERQKATEQISEPESE